MSIRLHRSWIVVGLTVLFCAFSSTRAATPEEIDAAIRRAVNYLYTTQRDGIWDEPAPNPNARVYDMNGGQWGGETAVCTYALITAGEKYEDPRLKPAIQFLIKSDITGIYAVGMRVQALNLIPKSNEIKQVMQKDLQLIQRAMIRDGPAKGLYDYTETARNISRTDHSVSQIGIIGAWAAADSLEIFPLDYWKTIDAAWRGMQRQDGSWIYYKESQQKVGATIAMTEAGVSTLFMTQDFLNRGKPADAAGNIHDANIDKGIKWIIDNYDTLLNGDRTILHYPYFGIYGIERVGAAGGFKRFGKVDWYENGADFLLKEQARNGGWAGSTNTALALLFLTHGRAPVAMNKLQYSLGAAPRTPEANWDQRPRDAANLTKYIGRQAERLLNWQIVNLDIDVDDLLDAPILYIAGNQVVNFTADQKQKLKRYIEQGGMIMAHADVSSGPFANSIRKLGTELFKYEFRPLPAGHPIYTSEQFPASKWKRKPNVQGLSNGVRELILLLPDSDAARWWQAYEIGTHSEVFELGANIFQYSVDKENLRNKGESYLTKLDESIKPTKTVKIARVKYEANWDPEPAGWPRLTALCNNIQQLGLAVQPVDVKQLGSTDAKIAHLTGTGPIKFNDAARDAIKKFVNGGGVLIVDSAGGSAQFSQSIEQEFDAMFGDAAKSLKEPLPADHPIYKLTGRLDVEYRPFARRDLSGDLKVGRIRMMELNGKPAIIYSPEDLTEGLVGQPVDGVIGYTPQTAWRLMSNIIQYAMGESR